MFGLAPTAKGGRVLARNTGMITDTVAKLLYEWHRPDRPPGDEYRLPPGAAVVVDEAGMIGTPVLYQLVNLAERHRWRLALAGDHRQLQAVVRGGRFAELCTNGRAIELEHLHRFTHHREAMASLGLRHGNPTALDAYQAHDRIIAGTLESHLDRIAATWITYHEDGDTVATVASTNDHVDVIDEHAQQARLDAGHLDPDRSVLVAGGEQAHVGDVVVTCRDDRRLVTSTGEPIRNRETWTVTGIGHDGSLTVTQHRRPGTVTLPMSPDHLRQIVTLGGRPGLSHDPRHARLVETTQQWARASGIELPRADLHTRQRLSAELGLQTRRAGMH